MSGSKVVLITGSSSGFGELFVHQLLEKGHTVLATMRGLAGKNAEKAEKLKKAAEGKPGSLHLFELDVTNETSVESAVRLAVEQAGQIDVVINNAGYGVVGFSETVTTEQLHKVFDVNVYGVHRVTRAVLPTMRRQGKGLIVNVSSIMGRMVIPFAGAYTSTKYALEGMSETLRYELSGTGVDVVIVEPGSFATGFMNNMEQGRDEARLSTYGDLKGLPDQMWKGFGEQIHSESGPDPSEVATAVAELIDTPAGQRPLRVVVDPMMGGEAPRAINQNTDKIQSEFLTGIGMEQLKSVKG